MTYCQREWSCEKCRAHGAVESPFLTTLPELADLVKEDHDERSPSCVFDARQTKCFQRDPDGRGMAGFFLRYDSHPPAPPRED